MNHFRDLPDDVLCPGGNGFIRIEVKSLSFYYSCKSDYIKSWKAKVVAVTERQKIYAKDLQMYGGQSW